jgi:hypothetical protein
MSAEIAEPSFIMNTDCPSLNNSYPSFVMEVSCNNAYPENPNNLAYSLLKNGAVVTVASTRVSHYNTGAWTTSTADRYGDNDGFGYYLTKYMVAYPTCGVGTALNWVRSKLGTGWKSHSWMNLTDHNVYGDPSLGLNTGV